MVFPTLGPSSRWQPGQRLISAVRAAWRRDPLWWRRSSAATRATSIETDGQVSAVRRLAPVDRGRLDRPQNRLAM